ncbi:hypothetical protein [Sedimentibacter sp.]|uniref:hypothetical protein n=1 Tax=Sedimentibacter sp. TaxID=1960295 RepID=UPI0028ABDDA1|nr:hypothetical protein [Sedimentibacter sp.]
MNIEKLIDTATELKETTLVSEEAIRQANLKAEEKASICAYNSYSDSFQIFDGDVFLEICRTANKVPIKGFFSEMFKYKYIVNVEGFTFTCVTNRDLPFEGDENKIKEEI